MNKMYPIKQYIYGILLCMFTTYILSLGIICSSACGIWWGGRAARDETSGNNIAGVNIYRVSLCPAGSLAGAWYELAIYVIVTVTS